MSNSGFKQTHDHSQLFELDTQSSERKVNIVFALTFFTMFAEIIAGSWFGSMALLADGWHMFTHAAAFAIAMYVYWYAKKHRTNSTFTFGTGKVTSLGGFASAVALFVVALVMALESFERLMSPQDIQFKEAIIVAILGLTVNIISAIVLHDSHHHGHDHHGHDHHSHDHNLKAAYFHVLADTLTSLFAILALLAGMFLNWIWLDALMGIVGAAVISRWALGLLKESSQILLDKNETDKTRQLIEQTLADELSDTLTDFHRWQVSPKHSAMILAIETLSDRDTEFYKSEINKLIKTTHLTIEINRVCNE